METELFQGGGQIKREKDIYHHGPKHNPIICHLPDPPSFSLSTTFKGKNGNAQTKKYDAINELNSCQKSHQFDSKKNLCFSNMIWVDRIWHVDMDSKSGYGCNRRANMAPKKRN
jgi:hypothetical protein